MFKHIGSNWSLHLLNMAVMLVVTPYYIHALGEDVNGVWVSVLSATGFLTLLALGVPMAAVRHFAAEVAREDLAATNRAISSALGICIVLGGIALAVGALLFFGFEQALLSSERWSHLTEANVRDAKIGFVIVVVQIALAFSMQLPRALFDAHHDFVAKNFVMASTVVLKLVLVLVLLAWRPEITMLAVTLITCTVSEFALMVALVHRRYPGVRFGVGSFDRRMVRSILGFSVFATILNVGSMIAYRLDALVIGGFLDPEYVTFYDVGNKFFEPLTMFMIGIGVVVMPVATRMQARGELDQLRAVFLKWSKVSLSIVMAVGLYLIVLGPEFLGRWIGKEGYEERSGPVTQVLMLSFLVFLPVRAVSLPILLGVGKPGRPAVGLLVMSLANLGLSVALVRQHGILGVALGTAVPNVLYAGWLLRLACREVGESVLDWLRYVAGRALLGALPPLALLLALKSRVDADDFLPLLLAGVAMVAVYVLCWVFWVYRDDPYLDLRGMLGAKLSRIRRRPS